MPENLTATRRVRTQSSSSSFSACSFAESLPGLQAVQDDVRDLGAGGPSERQVVSLTAFQMSLHEVDVAMQRPCYGPLFSETPKPFFT